MTQKSFSKTCLGAVAAAVTALGFAGAAQAIVVYKGNFDPAYGSAFPQLGWRGEVFFNLASPSCLSLSTGWHGASGACAMSVQSGTLEFYNVANPIPTVESFVLGTGASIYQVYINGGVLTGIESGFFAPIVPVTPGGQAIAGNGNTWFHLKFLYDNPHIANTPTVQLYSTLGLVDPGCLKDSPPCAGGKSDNQATLTLTLVPEPETYALMLAGLGVVGFMARRARRA